MIIQNFQLYFVTNSTKLALLKELEPLAFPDRTSHVNVARRVHGGEVGEDVAHGGTGVGVRLLHHLITEMGH